MPNRFIINGEMIRNKKNISSAFNKYFASIGTEMADSLPTVPGYEEYLKLTNAKFHLREMTEEDVMTIMKKQQPKLSTGIDII